MISKVSFILKILWSYFPINCTITNVLKFNIFCLQFTTIYWFVNTNISAWKCNQYANGRATEIQDTIYLQSTLFSKWFEVDWNVHLERLVFLCTCSTLSKERETDTHWPVNIFNKTFALNKYTFFFFLVVSYFCIKGRERLQVIWNSVWLVSSFQLIKYFMELWGVCVFLCFFWNFSYLIFASNSWEQELKTRSVHKKWQHYKKQMLNGFV